MAKIQSDNSTIAVCLNAIDQATTVEQVNEAADGLLSNIEIVEAASLKIESLTN
jgi:hypothetical protein